MSNCEVVTFPLVSRVRWVILHAFLSSANFISKSFFWKKIVQEYHQSVKKFGSRSDKTFCQAQDGSKLFAAVIRRKQ